MTEKTREVAVTPEYLQRFPWPLWEKLTLDLDLFQNLPAIEGWQDGFRFTILELQHQGYGLQDERTVVTTFFVVEIPASQTGRLVGWRPADAQVSVDKAFVYLARPCQRARPRDWRDLITMTINVVESLKTREEAPASAARASTFQPKGDGTWVSALNGVLALVLTVLVMGYGVANMVGWVDYRTGCSAHSTKAKCRDTGQAYSVFEAILEGGKFVLLGLIPAYGVHHSLERIRTLRRIRRGG